MTIITRPKKYGQALYRRHKRCRSPTSTRDNLSTTAAKTAMITAAMFPRALLIVERDCQLVICLVLMKVLAQVVETDYRILRTETRGLLPLAI